MCLVWQASTNQKDLATVSSAASFPLEIEVNMIVMFSVRAGAQDSVERATGFASDGA